MSYYRLYSLDPSNKHIVDVSDFSANCDSAAILQVGSSMLGVSKELWNQDRKVRDFPSKVRPALQVASTLSLLIDSSRRWRWNPLVGHCQLVSYEQSPSGAIE